MPFVERLSGLRSPILSRTLRYGVILAVDAACTAAALYLAYLARFEGRIPALELARIPGFLLILVPIRLAFTLAFGVHRWSFRMSGLYEAVRLFAALLSGTACFVAVYYFYQRVGPPRSVILLEFFLTATAMAILRFSPRLASGWFVAHHSRGEGHLRTLVVGAGSAGDLLLRDLLRSREHKYSVVGFVDDDPRKRGMMLGGRPVLGAISDLPALIERHSVTQVLIAIPRLAAERVQTIVRLCASLKVQFKIIPVSFAYLNDRVAASMLHDLAPEDLLSRAANSFDPEGIRSKISGKRVMITGAAGSIGGEIARQVCGYGPQLVALVDINENDLYFLARELQDRHPHLDVRADIADIRDETRMLSLGEAIRPTDVFHAAAHKHVPLMEDAPEEAVKNNVFGTQNVARMADAYGAAHFVLISTDKAVHPSSVMGASKRIAELLVREMARTSSTRFTAVRFGNVLGSAGSVVPLFKKQIERGGPVTVTHPECRRYFMTIPEAVGLVLLAGLGGYGDLCMLDMGVPVKIVDLAAEMITMAGLIKDVDIRIEFIGLRAGEKLTEDLMTEEEEHSRVVHDRIHALDSPPPPADLPERLGELKRLAARGDRGPLLAAVRGLVPTFKTPVLTELRTPEPPSSHASLIEAGRTH